MRPAQSQNPKPEKPAPFSRNLKGLFFFLVVLVVVSQISPLLLLSRLIDQEESRLETRIEETIAELREKWSAVPAANRDSVDLYTVARQHNLRRVLISDFTPEGNGGRWRHRSSSADGPSRLGWDSVTVEPPEFERAGSSGPGTRHIGLSEIWRDSPIQAELLVQSPIVAGLERQFRIELWLRAIALASFTLFTLLFYRAVLLPFHDMRRRARELAASGIIPHTVDGNEPAPEYVMATFDHLVHSLSKQAGMLERRALHSERHARDLERFNDYILSSMTTGVIILDRDGDILRFNRAAERILRMPAAAMQGRHYAKAGLSPQLVELFRRGLDHNEMFSRHELRLGREADDPLFLGINTSCIKSDTDEAVGLSVLLTDLTAIKKLQDDVAENQRLADLGELAAGLAHQLRNSMAAILGYGRLLRKCAPDEGQMSDWAEGVLSETAETSEMIARFLDFSRPLHPEESVIDLADVLDACVRTVRPCAEESAVIIEEPEFIEAQPCLMRGDELLLRQVFVNLLQNAIESSRPEARVTLTVRRVATGPNAGRWLVSVADTGSGIEPENQIRIFHPFFTTKQTGTGLGLALARKITLTHGGSLSLQHSTSAGSTFLVMLPVHEPVPAVVSAV